MMSIAHNVPFEKVTYTMTEGLVQPVATTVGVLFTMGPSTGVLALSEIL